MIDIAVALAALVVVAASAGAELWSTMERLERRRISPIRGRHSILLVAQILLVAFAVAAQILVVVAVVTLTVVGVAPPAWYAPLGALLIVALAVPQLWSRRRALYTAGRAAHTDSATVERLRDRVAEQRARADVAEEERDAAVQHAVDVYRADAQPATPPAVDAAGPRTGAGAQDGDGGRSGDAEVATCPRSRRVDGPHHSTRWDGDDPYTTCVYCGQMRDARTGAVLGYRPADEEAAAEGGEPS